MRILAKDVMSKHDLVTVSPHTTIEELDHLFIEKEVSGVPVVNDRREVVGVVSRSDIVRFLHAELAHDLNFFNSVEQPRKPKSGEAAPASSLDRKLHSREVWELMQTRIHSVTPDTDVPTIAKILRRHHIHRVLVMEGKRLIGIISAYDLISLLEDPAWLRNLGAELVESSGDLRFETQ